MSATQIVPVVVPVAPVVPAVPVAPVVPVVPVAPGRHPSRSPTKAHKNPDFVLEMPENWGSGGQKRTKMPILCSGGRGLASGREEISIGKRNRRDVYPSCKSPRTFQKLKYLITR